MTHVPAYASAILLSVALFLLLARVVRRAGFSRWWVLLALVPLVNVLVLWVFAYSRWPALDEERRRG
jgi:hypothetical protein